MFGVMRETFERDGGSMRGEDDFFSVARTIPFVAGRVLDTMVFTLMLSTGSHL